MSNATSTDLSVLRFKLILRDAAGQVVRDLSTKKRGRIGATAHKYEWATAHLIVRYVPLKAVNEGIYTTHADLSNALRRFCEPELLDYLGLAGGAA
jgi:regulator of sigma D